MGDVAHVAPRPGDASPLEPCSPSSRAKAAGELRAPGGQNVCRLAIYLSSPAATCTRQYLSTIIPEICLNHPASIVEHHQYFNQCIVRPRHGQQQKESSRRPRTQTNDPLLQEAAAAPGSRHRYRFTNPDHSHIEPVNSYEYPHTDRLPRPRHPLPESPLLHHSLHQLHPQLRDVRIRKRRLELQQRRNRQHRLCVHFERRLQTPRTPLAPVVSSPSHDQLIDNQQRLKYRFRILHLRICLRRHLRPSFLLLLRRT